MSDQDRGPADVPALTVTRTDRGDAHDCELCRALLAVGESIAAAEAREAADVDERRRTMENDG